MALIPKRILIPLALFLSASSLLAQGHDRWHQQFRVRMWNPVSSNDWVQLDLADVNGDGEPDLLYGDPQFHDGGNRFDVGRVIVLDGVTGNLLFEVVGTLRGGLLGTKARFLEDIDGDGVADIAVTDRQIGKNFLHLYSGATFQKLNRRLGFPDFVDVISVGDHTGDGRAELAAVRNNRAVGPALEILDGATGDVLKRRSIPDVSVGLTRLGDLDGDGLPEIGSFRPYSSLGDPDQCEVLRGTNLRPLPMFSAEMYHATLLADAGDVNADGIPDILVGDSWNHTNGVYFSGEAKVVSGADGSLIAHHVGFTGDQVGSLLHGMGDVDHDGHDDYLVGSKYMSYGDGLGTHAASVRMYSGSDHSEQDRFFARSRRTIADRSIAVSPATATDGPTFAVVDPKRNTFRPMVTRLYLFTYGP